MPIVLLFRRLGGAIWGIPGSRRPKPSIAGGGDYRGGNGPLHVTAPRISNPLYGVFLEAVRQAGYPETAI